MMNLIPNGIASIGYSYLRTLWNAKRFKSRAKLEQWQERKMQALLKKVLPLSSFYRTRLAGKSVSEWRDMPVIDKSIMMAHFHHLNTVAISTEQAFEVAFKAEASRDFAPMIDNIAVGLSSGTSGNRGLFLVSHEERLAWTGAILAKVIPDFWRRAERIALFLRSDNNLYQTLNKSRQVRFQFFDLQTPLEVNLARLEAYQPTLLVGPPSLLRMVAEATQRQKLKISPRKIISAAEVLEPLDSAFLEDVFQQPIHQIYQCTEGFLASTCQYGTLHLNEDMVIVEKEYIDREQGRFIPIITDLNRMTQPIIRYHLNDILTESRKPCPCGSIFMALEMIEGRCDDLIYLPGLTGALQPVFPDFIRRAVMTASPEIAEYLIRQTAPQRLEVYLKYSETLAVSHISPIQEKVQQQLDSLCEAIHCQKPVISFEPYPALDIASGKKLRRIQRSWVIEACLT